MKATARIPISANGASNPGVEVVVVDLVVLAGSVLGVVLVVVAVVLVSETGVVLVVFVVDLVTSGPGIVVVVVDLVTFAAEPRARNAVSIIMAISMTANIFLMS